MATELKIAVSIPRALLSLLRVHEPTVRCRDNLGAGQGMPRALSYRPSAQRLRLRRGHDLLCGRPRSRAVATCGDMGFLSRQGLSREPGRTGQRRAGPAGGRLPGRLLLLPSAKPTALTQYRNYSPID